MYVGWIFDYYEKLNQNQISIPYNNQTLALVKFSLSLILKTHFEMRPLTEVDEYKVLYCRSIDRY